MDLLHLGERADPLAGLADLLDPRPSEYVTAPVKWVRDKCGEFMWRDQRLIAETLVEHRYVAVQSCHDVGKALALDTPIPTPTGWTTMGELRVGDEVYAEDGKPCRVTAVSPTWEVDTYRVLFDDYEELTCAGAHEWTVLTHEVRHAYRSREGAADDWRDHWALAETVETIELRETRHRSGARRWLVPNTRSLEGTAPDLHGVSPYVLGYWLGDGTTVNSGIAIGEQDREDVTALLEAEGERLSEWRRAAVNVYGLAPRLRNLGVLGAKHIPSVLLRADRETRLALLQGLMDSDGSSSTGTNLVGIGLTNKRLADGVYELVVSLGWKARRSIKRWRLPWNPDKVVTAYILNFTPDECVFRLPRKAANFTVGSRQRSARTGRVVIDVTRVATVPTRCITVDSPSHLFLAGRGMVPTHNSYTASRLVGWWLDSHPPGEAFVVTTAPTAAQVSAILWREIGRMHRKAKLNGRVTGQNEWKLELGGPAELVAYGRKPADYDPAAFQGIHARYVLVILDEAGGIPKLLYDAVDALATNQYARVLAVGNPDDPASHFKTICEPGSGWKTIRIDALRSPNFTAAEVAKFPELEAYMKSEGIEPTDEVVPDEIRDLLVSPLWVAERIKRWGVNSPLFTSKVRGHFPKVTLDTLINPHWVELAKYREVDPVPTAARLGVDVARYGADQTIILLRQGGHCRVVHEIARGPVTEVAGLTQQVGLGLHPAQPPVACVDDVGVGGGVTDILEEEGYPVEPIIGGAASTGELLPNGKPRFNNLRSQLWWNMREAFAGKSGDGSDGWLDIDPDDEELQAQLTNVKYRINRHGQIEVESKDSMKDRGLASPDRGDALAYSLAPVTTRAKLPRTDLMLTADLLTTEW